MITVGVDIGSTTTKVLFLRDKEAIYKDICNTGTNPKMSAEKLFHNGLKALGITISEISSIISTGYGRRAIDFGHKTVTEISACAQGIRFCGINARTIIDLGGQDTKIISLDENSEIVDFAMNDKCAAGTGKFLEVIADRLGVKVEELGRLSENSKEKITINSTCTVFAESEVISLIAQNKKIEDIVAGIHSSITERIIVMIKQVGLREPVVFCGGGAKNYAIHKMLEDKLNTKVIVPSFVDPQFVIALGAAVM